jgi:hypothetical protein
MSDHTQHDEAAQLRAVIYDLKAENKELAANASRSLRQGSRM